jgi:hypothetical protein
MKTTTSAPVQPAVQQELQFRLSLLRLMTVPHRSVPGVSPAMTEGPAMEASRTIEELAVLVPRSQA